VQPKTKLKATAVKDGTKRVEIMRNRGKVKKHRPGGDWPPSRSTQRSNEALSDMVGGE
jgi:hypothetical protein